MLCVFASVGLTSVPAEAQGRSASRDGDTKELAVARSIMERTRYCALITMGSDGRASTRTVDPLAPDSQFVVRFATNPKSRKVGELAQNPRVTLYYFDAKTLSYVSLYGTARRITDARERTAAWKEEWSPFYKNRDDGVALYAVRPERLEVVSVSEGVSGDTITWAPPSLRPPSPATKGRK